MVEATVRTGWVDGGKLFKDKGGTAGAANLSCDCTHFADFVFTGTDGCARSWETGVQSVVGKAGGRAEAVSTDAI